MSDKQLTYIMNDPIEVNLSYMPFIAGGGIFVPTPDKFLLGERVILALKLPNEEKNLSIEGKIIWITPSNALHHVIAGVGIQFTGSEAPAHKDFIENKLNKQMEIGSYTYGITTG